MKKYQTLITAAFSSHGLQSLGEKMSLEYHNWMLQKRPYNQDELMGMVKDKEILIVEVCEVQRAVIEAADKLQIVACCRGLKGDDSTIDIQALNERGIPVLFTPGRNFDSVAEMTILMTLAIMKKIHPATKWLYENKWQEWLDFYTNFRTTELKGKTVGLIGFGNIGKRVATLFKAFETRVLAYDPYVNDPAVYRQTNVEKVELEYLVRNSDVVSLHMNVSGETKGIIGERELSWMKPTAYLINSARAAVIDHKALYEALRDKRIAGAAVDVFHKEPSGPDREPLLTLDNVFATPHLGGTADEVIENHSRMVLEDLERLMKGEKPLNILNPDVLPAFFARMKKNQV